MKTTLRTIARGIVLAAAGFAFARLLGPKACATCKAHCGEHCGCMADQGPSETSPEMQQTA